MPDGFEFPKERDLLVATDHGTGIVNMPSGDVHTETGHWKPRLTRAALWALLGGLSVLPGFYIEGIWYWAIVSWSTAGWASYFVSVGMLLAGLAYAALLGVAVYRAGLAGWGRATGFALLAMPWLAVALNTGVAVYDIYVRIFDVGYVVREFIFAFLIWFSGLFAGSVWVTLACLALVPSLRARRPFTWQLLGGTAFAVMAGIIAMVNFDGLLNAMQFAIAVWCATYAAAFSMALLRARRSGRAAVQPLAEQVIDR